LEFKAIFLSLEKVHNYFPPILKIIVHEKFHSCIKNAGIKKEFTNAKKQPGKARKPNASNYIYKEIGLPFTLGILGRHLTYRRKTCPSPLPVGT
jgi:hypothetical protein